MDKDLLQQIHFTCFKSGIAESSGRYLQHVFKNGGLAIDCKHSELLFTRVRDNPCIYIDEYTNCF